MLAILIGAVIALAALAWVLAPLWRELRGARGSGVSDRSNPAA
jgi:hypothetical protein